MAQPPACLLVDPQLTDALALAFAAALQPLVVSCKLHLHACLHRHSKKTSSLTKFFPLQIRVSRASTVGDKNLRSPILSDLFPSSSS